MAGGYRFFLFHDIDVVHQGASCTSWISQCHHNVHNVIFGKDGQGGIGRIRSLELPPDPNERPLDVNLDLDFLFVGDVEIPVAGIYL